jgi:putative transposase
MLQRRRGQRRNHPAVVREVRAGLGQPAAPAPGPGRATRGISMKSSSKINGTIHVLGRAVDQHGNVLDISGAVTPKRGGRLKVRPPTAHGTAVRGAAARHRQARQRPACPPRADALGEHRQSKYLNNRAENSHQPTRQRERAMKRFTSPGMRNGSYPRSATSRHISVRVGICCRPPDGATRWPTASPSATR